MWHNQVVMAEVVDWVAHESFNKSVDILQSRPYEKHPDLVFRINSKHPRPDNYQHEAFGLPLYSKRVIQLMRKFDVHFEYFPVTMVDSDNVVQKEPDYYIFHFLEAPQDAMDKEKSKWQGSSRIGVPQLILDYTRFEHRPVIKCTGVNVDLIRDDVKREIEEGKMTGFDFFRPEDYSTGRQTVLRLEREKLRKKRT